MQFEYWYQGWIFIGMILLIVGLPCVLTAILGTRLIDEIGNRPSSSAQLHMGVCLKLLVVEIFSFAMLILFFHIFSD